MDDDVNPKIMELCKSLYDKVTKESFNDIIIPDVLNDLKLPEEVLNFVTEVKNYFAVSVAYHKNEDNKEEDDIEDVPRKLKKQKFKHVTFK